MGFLAAVTLRLRSRRGIFYEKAAYLPGVFELVHNVRKHGHALLDSLLGKLLQLLPYPQGQYETKYFIVGLDVVCNVLFGIAYSFESLNERFASIS